MHKKISLLLLLLLPLGMFAQVNYSGPAAGSSSGVTTLNTNSFTNSSNESNARYKFFHHIKADAVADPENLLEPTGAEGSNFIEDPAAFGNVNRDGEIELFQSFYGIPQTSFIPPDPHMAVGPDHIMQVVNSTFRITDKEGNNVTTINADTWYGQVHSGASTFDPKVIYDHFDNRWVMVWLHLNEGQNEALFLISVSDDADPNGIWYNFKQSSATNGNSYAGNWADYQGVGYDEDAIYITSNQFSFSFFYDYTKLRIVNKSDLYASNPNTVNWNDIWDISYPGTSNAGSFGIRPARMQDANDEYYLLAVSPYNTKTSVGLYKLTDPLNNPVLNGSQISCTQYSSPNNADQLGGGSPKLESGGDNLRNEPEFKNGLLHATHSVANGSVSALRYLGINPSTNTADFDFAMGTGTHYHFYPALTVNGFGDVLLTYSRSSTSEYVGAYYTVLRSGESQPVGSMMLKEGNGNYVKTYGGSRNRWGDYMGAWFDPADPNKFWMLTEYAHATDTWGVWVGGVSVANADLPVWKGTLTVTDNGGRSSEMLEFGQAVTATAGIDSDLGENELPPVPPAGVFDTRFLVEGNAATLVDLRPSSADEIEFTFSFQPGSAGYPFTISWNPALLTGGKYTLQDAFGGSVIDVNMLGQNSLEVTNTGINTLKILFAKQVTVNSDVTPGWNIVSVPVNADDMTVTSLFENATSDAFEFNNGYSAVSTLEAGKGYWLKYGTSEPLTFMGQNVEGSVAVNAGWNMVGPFSREVTVAQITSDPANIVNSVFYGYNNGYDVVDKLMPGKGYWVKTSQAGNLYFGTQPSKAVSPLAALNDETTGQLLFTDAQGNSTSLYLVNGAATDMFVMPPKAPSGLDARFAGDKLAEDVSYGALSVNVSSDSYPVAMKVVNAELEITQNGSSAIYKSGDVVTISSPVIEIKSVSAPVNYELSQNYPNPFNPSTTISFTLPEANYVSIVVYNVLGEKVSDLVNRNIDAGTHKINFRADNLSSGTYLYKITAGSFTATRKMILLK